MARSWTEHKIRDSSLKQLAAAVNRADGSLYPGVGYGAPSSRAALISRGLAEEIYIKTGDPCAYCQVNEYNCWHSGGHHNTVITAAGREALAEARVEGW